MNNEPRFHGKVSPKSHKTMSRIKGKDTTIEVQLRKALWHRGIRYRKNYKKLPGSPDIAITKYRVAIFCDSEFFHGKDWDVLKSKLEKGTNGDYWIKKIEHNLERDREKDNALIKMGWKVLRFWGKEIQQDLNGICDYIEETLFSIKLGEETDYNVYDASF